jgi:photosystem II stability/assembly factor-like uncharacterized protein
MGRFIIIAVTVAGMLYGCASSRPPAREPLRVSNDTFAFAKYGKGVFFGVNAILRSDTSMILVTNQDIFKTTNSGASWESLAEPLPHKNITAVTAFADTIYAGSGHGTVYRTTDHGLQWRVHRRIGSNPIRGFSNSAEPITSDNLASHCWPRPANDIVRSDSTITHTTPFGISRSISWGLLQGARACIASDSRIVAATGENDIAVYNITNATVDHYTLHLLQGQTTSALAVSDDMLFVGTKLALGGVFRLKLGTTSWEQMLIDRIEGSLDVNTLMVNDRGVYVASREHGVLVIPPGSNIMRSLSDGIHLALHQGVSQMDSTYVVSSRMKGALAFTANGDNLRVLSTTAPSSPEYVITTISKAIVMGLADGSVYVSTDQGTTWQFRSKPFEQSELTSLRVVGNSLYACAVSGLYVSNDTATSFTQVTEMLKGENVQSVTQTDSMLIIFASSGTYTLDRRGKLGLFSPGIQADYQIRLNDAIVHNGYVLAVGYPGLFVSSDAGVSWSLTTIPKAMVLRTVYCDTQSVYVVGDDGDIYVSPIPQWIQKRTTPR